MSYILGLDVLLMIHHIYTSYIDIIFCLNLAFFYFLYSLTLMFSLKHVVSPIRLRLHVTQEVPLPPYNLNRSCHIEDNVQLGWGES